MSKHNFAVYVTYCIYVCNVGSHHIVGHDSTTFKVYAKIFKTKTCGDSTSTN